MLKTAVPPGDQVKLAVERKHHFHWYDLDVTIPQIVGFEYRFAGRAETGEGSFSDPAMVVKTLAVL